MIHAKHGFPLVSYDNMIYEEKNNCSPWASFWDILQL